MYQQQKKELLDRECKHIPGFPGLMERVKLEPVVEDKKTVKVKAGKETAPPPVDTSAGLKKVGRPKKVVI